MAVYDIRSGGEKALGKTNLLWIIADDHAGYVLGAGGNDRAKTPNLDRLAAQSVRFSSAYCNSPVCTPSRASFFTGRYPHSAGVTKLDTAMPEGQVTVASQLKKSGYWTGVVGKMHFNQPGRPGLHGFDLCKTEDVATTEWLAEKGGACAITDIETRPPWKPFGTPAGTWLNADKRPVPRRASEGRSSWIVEEAARQLEAHSDAPFALWVSFQEPHAPFDFPTDFVNVFDAADFPIPDVGPEDGGQVPAIFKDLTPAQKRGIIAAYYTSVAYLDWNVGRLLDKLEEMGLSENTLVVYSADHGYSLGQHGRFEKHCHYEPAIRVPLLLRQPGVIEPGVVDGLVELVDLPVTLLDLLGAEPFPVTHGQSLAPLLNADGTGGRDNIFSEWLGNEEASIRTRDWKYIQMRGQSPRKDGYASVEPPAGRVIELFDLNADPEEFHNVAGAHPDIVKELAEIMLKRFRDTHPDSDSEPEGLDLFDTIDWYLVSRDGPGVPRSPVPSHPL